MSWLARLSPARAITLAIVLPFAMVVVIGVILITVVVPALRHGRTDYMYAISVGPIEYAALLFPSAAFLALWWFARR